MRAKTKEEYVNFMARLILQVREQSSRGPQGGGSQPALRRGAPSKTPQEQLSEFVKTLEGQEAPSKTPEEELSDFVKTL